MTGGKRGRLVEEEQLGVALPPDVAVPSLELEDAADPTARHPSAQPERAVVAVKVPPAIAEEQPARGIGEELPERIDAVGERHGDSRMMGWMCG